MTQETLNFDEPAPWHFNGATYNPAKDKARLGAQLIAVFNIMSDGAWHTLTELSRLTGASEASASARLRDLRKPRFGARTINRRRAINGLFEYQMAME